MVNLKIIGIVCIIWGLLMLVLGGSAFGDIGISFLTQGVFAIIVGITFLELNPDKSK